MIQLILSGLDYDTKRLGYAQTAIEIGADESCDLVLAGKPVAPRHARIVIMNGAYYVEDLGSATGTFVNDHRITAPTVIRYDDRLKVGNHIIQIESASNEVEANAQEEALLEAIDAGDDGSRVAYADWLEETGDKLRADYVRLQDLIADAPGSHTDTLRRLSRSLDIDWRARIARVPIEQCRIEWRATCPRMWDALAPTDDPVVRHCATCQRSVYYCDLIEKARRLAATGECVAIDAMVRPTPGDNLGMYKCTRCDGATDYGQLRCPRCDALIGNDDDFEDDGVT